MPGMSDIWYYAQGESSIGPLSLIDLRKVLSLTSDARNVLVWRSDFADWKKAESVEELVAVVIRPPPIKPVTNSPPLVQPTQAAASSAPSEQAFEKPKKREPFLAVDSTHIHDAKESPAQLVRRADLATKIMAGLSVAFFCCVVWRVYLFQVMLDLVRRYGYGHMPQEMIPQSLSQIDMILWVASWCWSLGTLVCVMYCFSQIYTVLQTRFGQHFNYSFGWTILSAFIPLVFLVRPWLGFGEIRRKMIAACHGETRTFDFFTLVFALTYILGMVTMKFISQEENELAKAPSIDQSYFDSAINFDLAYAASALVVGLVAFFYCRSVVVGVREAMVHVKKAP
jgi:hypothetical protein